jgi:hypothetical protein
MHGDFVDRLVRLSALVVQPGNIVFRSITSSPDHSVVDRTKKGISQLITKGWEVVFQWISSHFERHSNDIVDGLAKDSSNLPSPEQPTNYHQAVADITIKSTLLVLDVAKYKRR